MGDRLSEGRGGVDEEDYVKLMLSHYYDYYGFLLLCKNHTCGIGEALRSMESRTASDLLSIGEGVGCMTRSRQDD